MRRVLPALSLLALLAGCAARDVVTIDRSFLREFPLNPKDEDLAGHYRNLRYLASNEDPEAVYAVLLYVTSDERTEQLATTECPFHSTEDLAVAAYNDGDVTNAFWAVLPRLSPERQARALIHYSYLYDRTDSSGMHLYSMVDFTGYRDDYIGSHPLVLAALRGPPLAPWATAAADGEVPSP